MGLRLVLFQMHGFYGDEEKRQISFDVIFNFDEKKTETIVEEIKKDMKNKHPKYNYNIIIDIDFSD